MIVSSASIKIPELIVDGLSVPLSGPILDIPVKIENIVGNVKVLIETLLVFDGISLRRLDIRDTRNMLTITGLGKVSMQGKTNTLSSVGWDARDIALDVWWAWFLKPAMRILKFWAKKLGFLWNADEQSQFYWELFHQWKKLWTSDFSIKKWHKYKQQGDEIHFLPSLEGCVWKCVLRINILLELSEMEWKRVVSRTNVPIFWLSRDHARDVMITTITRVSLDTSTIIGDFTTYLNLWPIKYKKL